MREQRDYTKFILSLLDKLTAFPHMLQVAKHFPMIVFQIIKAEPFFSIRQVCNGLKKVRVWMARDITS